MWQLSLLVAIIAVAGGIIGIHHLYKSPEMPDFDLDKWWGSGSKPELEDTSVRTFEIKFDATAIKDLRERIMNRRTLTKSLEGIQSQFGINIDYLEEKLQYWVEKYDFYKRAQLLNYFPHYKTKIQGLDIHFMRIVPKPKDNVKVLPILLLHGWPSSSKEFDKVIPLLTTQRKDYNFVFEVVAADLPGFGYSEGTNKPGLSPVQIGIIMRNLMQRLGYKRFYIQAGDWGSQCATHMSTMFPDEILGFHTNMPSSTRRITTIKTIVGSLAPSLAADSRYVDRIYPLSNLLKYLWRESGYFHIQATKPDSIGVALTDSPTGLAAYLMEKIAICTDRRQLDTKHGGLDNLDIDDVLDIITINWFNNNAVTSARLYSEGLSGQNDEVMTVHNIPSAVPTAAINFLNEVLYQPDWMLRDKFTNLVRSTTLDFGGHFAALQTPKVLVDDVFAATKEFLKFHKNL